MALHTHTPVPDARGTLRCGDPACRAWMPGPAPDPEAAGPAALPPRVRKPAKPKVGKRTAASKPADPVSNVVPLARKKES